MLRREYGSSPRRRARSVSTEIHHPPEVECEKLSIYFVPVPELAAERGLPASRPSHGSLRALYGHGHGQKGSPGASMPFVVFESSNGVAIEAAAPEGGRLVDLCDEHRAPVPFSCPSANCGTCRIAIL